MQVALFFSLHYQMSREFHTRSFKTHSFVSIFKVRLVSVKWQQTYLILYEVKTEYCYQVFNLWADGEVRFCCCPYKASSYVFLWSNSAMSWFYNNTVHLAGNVLNKQFSFHLLSVVFT